MDPNPNPNPANPHRWLSLKIAIVLLCIFGVNYAATPTDGRVAGTWVSDSDSGMVAVNLRKDGTYIQYDQGQEISRGTWRLDNSLLIFRNLELDGSYRLPVGLDDLQLGKGNMVYSLSHREGKLCLKTGEEPVYWCKTN